MIIGSLTEKAGNYQIKMVSLFEKKPIIKEKMPPKPKGNQLSNDHSFPNGKEGNYQMIIGTNGKILNGPHSCKGGHGILKDDILQFK